MTIYDIDQGILELIENSVDPETGEITDEAMEKLAALQMERDRKIENLVCYIKNLDAEAKALREEEKALRARREIKERKIERLQKFLESVLNGQKFESARAAVNWRQTERVEIDEDAFLACDDNERIVGAVTFEPKFSKAVIKTAIKNGLKVVGAQLVKYKSMTIK